MATAPTRQGPNTIVLKGRLDEKYEEGRVGVGQTITPGMLVEHDAVTTYEADDENATYKPHATATGAAVPAIAVESVFTSQPDATGKGGTIDDNYVAGDLLRMHLCQPGDIIYGWLKTGNNATVNSKLASAGDGTFQVSTTNPLFEAVSYLNNTSGVKKRLKMRKL